MIPKVIWQTHRFHKDNLPPYVAAATGTWPEVNPDFEYRYVSNDEAIEQIDELQNGRFSQIIRYPFLTGIARADIWRIVIMQSVGGVYVDADTACLMPLCEFIDLSKDFIIEGQPPEYAPSSRLIKQIVGDHRQHFGALNGFIASSPDNIFINAICDAAETMCMTLMKQREFIGPACGPALFTAVLNKFWNDLGDSMLKTLSLSRMPPNFDHYLLGNGDPGMIELNGSFSWVDRLSSRYSSDVTQIMDKFLDPFDQSCMANGGPVDKEKEGSGYHSMYEQVDIKLSRATMHLGSHVSN